MCKNRTSIFKITAKIKISGLSERCSCWNFKRWTAILRSQHSLKKQPPKMHQYAPILFVSFSTGFSITLVTNTKAVVEMYIFVCQLLECESSSDGCRHVSTKWTPRDILVICNCYGYSKEYQRPLLWNPYIEKDGCRFPKQHQLFLRQDAGRKGFLRI